MLFDKLIKGIKSNLIKLPESCIDDIKETIVDLKLRRIDSTEQDRYDIIKSHFWYGHTGINDKSTLDVIDELLEEYELNGYECFENEDSTVDCSELDNPLIDLLSKHFTNIELTRLIGVRPNEEEKT